MKQRGRALCFQTPTLPHAIIESMIRYRGADPGKQPYIVDVCSTVVSLRPKVGIEWEIKVGDKGYPGARMPVAQRTA